MESAVGIGNAIWAILAGLGLDVWLLIVAVLILLQLMGIGRSARRLGRRIGQGNERLDEIDERIGMILDKMVDAEERLLSVQAMTTQPGRPPRPAEDDAEDA